MTSEARNAAERLETIYDFQCEAGPLKNCVEWQQIRAYLALAKQPAQSEGATIAKLREETAGIITQIGERATPDEVREVVERLHKVASRLDPLKRQGEDYIWRPVTDACEALRDAASLLSRLSGERERAVHKALSVAGSMVRNLKTPAAVEVARQIDDLRPTLAANEQ